MKKIITIFVLVLLVGCTGGTANKDKIVSMCTLTLPGETISKTYEWEFEENSKDLSSLTYRQESSISDDMFDKFSDVDELRKSYEGIYIDPNNPIKGVGVQVDINAEKKMLIVEGVVDFEQLDENTSLESLELSKFENYEELLEQLESKNFDCSK